MDALDREGRLDVDGMLADPPAGATLSHEFRDEMRPADVPASVRRFAFPILAVIGERFGYGVPEYSDERVAPERTV